jgi:hypothetical protein
MRMRKISWGLTSCNYLSWKHSHSALAKYTLLEVLDVFSLCAVIVLPVALTNSSPRVPSIVSSLLQRAKYAHPPRELSCNLWYAGIPQITTRLRTRQHRKYISILRWGKRLFSSPKFPYLSLTWLRNLSVVGSQRFLTVFTIQLQPFVLRVKCHVLLFIDDLLSSRTTCIICL